MNNNFRKQLDAAYQKKVVETQEKVARGTGLSVLNELVFNTPVDTGRARGNWNIDVNAVDLTEREADPSGNGAISRGLSFAASYKLNDTIFISNNLPYINRLNEGSSIQQPAGFFEAAIQVGNAKAKEIARGL